MEKKHPSKEGNKVDGKSSKPPAGSGIVKASGSSSPQNTNSEASEDDGPSSEWIPIERAEDLPPLDPTWIPKPEPAKQRPRPVIVVEEGVSQASSSVTESDGSLSINVNRPPVDALTRAIWKRETGEELKTGEECRCPYCPVHNPEPYNPQAITESIRRGWAVVLPPNGPAAPLMDALRHGWPVILPPTFSKGILNQLNPPSHAKPSTQTDQTEDENPAPSDNQSPGAQSGEDGQPDENKKEDQAE